MIFFKEPPIITDQNTEAKSWLRPSQSMCVSVLHFWQLYIILLTAGIVCCYYWKCFKHRHRLKYNLPHYFWRDEFFITPNLKILFKVSVKYFWECSPTQCWVVSDLFTIYFDFFAQTLNDFFPIEIILKIGC